MRQSSSVLLMIAMRGTMWRSRDGTSHHSPCRNDSLTYLSWLVGLTRASRTALWSDVGALMIDDELTC